jgi:hypothetical protein
MMAGVYDVLLSGIAELLDQSRRAAARTVNGILTATYWEIGCRIVLFEQGGKARAEYGEALLTRLGNDLSGRYGRGLPGATCFRRRSRRETSDAPPVISQSRDTREHCQRLGLKTGRTIYPPVRKSSP